LAILDEGSLAEEAGKRSDIIYIRSLTTLVAAKTG